VSALAEAVVDRLANTGLNLSTQKVDETLVHHGVPTSASKAVPVPLRVRRIHFRGIKHLKPDHPSALASYSNADAVGALFDADVSQDREVHPAAMYSDTAGDVIGDEPDAKVQNGGAVSVPFEFQWEPQIGVNGIGSNKNLRGKSSVLNVLMWALTGRNAHFQPDILSWIEYVEVDWAVGSERLRVSFSATDGAPSGLVQRVDDVPDGLRVTQVAQFHNADQFEGVMGNLMMTRLRLEAIPVWTDDKPVRHSWPAYSSAFTVRSNVLDPIVGNETTIGIRMMQMFVGTDWAPAAAAITTARRRLDNERIEAGRRADAARQAVRESRELAELALKEVQAKIAALPTGSPDVSRVLDATARASALSRELHVLETRLWGQAGGIDTVRQQLRIEKARLHTQWEDALATKFFQRMQPTVCPRCASTITHERKAAETDKHECSVCTSGLNLDALNAEVVVSASVSDDVTASLISTAKQQQSDEAEDGDPAPTETVEALEVALAAAENAADGLRQQIAIRATERDAAVAAAEAGEALLAAAGERRQLDLDLARAEGAVSALTLSEEPVADPVNPSVAAVLEAAEKVIKNWVKDDQTPLLQSISATIERLAINFGADTLSGVKLNGGAKMDLVKGDTKVTYGKLTDGEKLRVKIATAIALIHHGYVQGVGRHPGLLVLDSPAAEEMPEEDLATMVDALNDVAREAEMQIFVATRNAQPLIDLLPESNRLVAEGEGYVW
jgi:hypothetical protein